MLSITQLLMKIELGTQRNLSLSSSIQRKIKWERGSVFFGLLTSVSQGYSTLQTPLSVCEPIFLSFPRSCNWHEVNDLNPATAISFPHPSYKFEHGWYFYQTLPSLSLEMWAYFGEDSSQEASPCLSWWIWDLDWMAIHRCLGYIPNAIRAREERGLLFSE